MPNENKTQLQTNNTALASLTDRVLAAKDTAAALPDAGSGGAVETFDLLASGSITGSGNSTITIPHSCGVVPKMLQLFYQRGSEAYSVSGMVLYRSQDNLFTGFVFGYAGSTTVFATSYPSMLADATILWDKSSIVVNSILSTDYIFPSSKSYTWRVYG